MKTHSSILPHLIGFFLTLILTLILIAYNLFRLPNFSPLPKTFFLQPSTLVSLLSYRRPDPVICHPTTKIYPQTYQQAHLNQSLEVFPQCSQTTCAINSYNPETHKPLTFPAITIPIPDQPISTLDNFFFDETNHIISYTTNLPDENTRIVLDFSGNLLHYIDETPGISHQLELLHYQPESDMLVYQDNFGNHYYYSATSIALFRNLCPRN